MDFKNKMATQVKKIPELDIMKFYGILFVVLGHIAMDVYPIVGDTSFCEYVIFYGSSEKCHLCIPYANVYIY